jgi:prevent-host-death family protein
MDTVNIHQAKTNLSRLLSRVELGEEIVISNRGVPVAKLVPFQGALDPPPVPQPDGGPPKLGGRIRNECLIAGEARGINFPEDRRSSLGQDRGKFTVPDDFNAPLPEDILAAFEGDVE